jgi:hypothetical protein
MNINDNETQLAHQLLTASTERALTLAALQQPLSSTDFLYECRAELLCVSAANEAWVKVKCRIRPYDLVLFREDYKHHPHQKQTIQLALIPYAQIVGIMLNPDNNEIRAETKPQITSYSGWYVIRFNDFEDYESVKELIMNKSLDVAKHIIYEYKTKQQDLRFGLIDNLLTSLTSGGGANGKSNKVETPKLITKPYKTGWLTFKVYS